MCLLVQVQLPVCHDWSAPSVTKSYLASKGGGWEEGGTSPRLGAF